MGQLQDTWANLGLRKRIMAGAAAAFVFILVFVGANVASRPDLALLYSGLDSAAAGDVVSALEGRGIAYDVRGDSIFVDRAERDSLRMTLAAEGLPANASDGYELLDRMTGFGTTSQMFDAAYWRAKEGELARTIMTAPQVQAARVHIANPGTKPFQRDRTPTASVTLTPTGGGISAAQARAFRFLVASAVSGLAPDDVSVIDANGGVILSSEAGTGPVPGATGRAAELKRNVERLLEARVGYGHAVVEVNVETVSDREEILERRIDPQSRVAIATQKSETSRSSNESGTGEVTVASNLPDGEAGPGGDNSQSRATETNEQVNYEISEIERQILRNPGAVARISTAVLVDGLRETGPDGGVAWSPRPAEEMQALRELVAAAVGFNEERGDTLSLQTMEFEPLPTDGSGPAMAGTLGSVNAMRLAQIAILGAVALALGLFVVRPILTPSRRATALAAPGAEPEVGDDLPGDFGGFATSNFDLNGPFDGEIDPADGPDSFEGLPDASLPISSDPDGRSPVDRLRRLIDERQEESLQILRSWMEDDKETSR